MFEHIRNKSLNSKCLEGCEKELKNIELDVEIV